MPYHAAWRVGWSFFWRRWLWLAALGLCAAAVVLLTRDHPRPLYLEALAATVIVVEAFVIHPLVVRSLPGILYRDFRLEVAGRQGPRDELTYREALLISIGPSAILIFCESMALFRVRPALFVAYPLAAWMLTYPWRRCRLEAVERLGPYGPAVL